MCAFRRGGSEHVEDSLTRRLSIMNGIANEKTPMKTLELSDNLIEMERQGWDECRPRNLGTIRHTFKPGGKHGKKSMRAPRFTPCAADGSLLEAETEAAKCWLFGDAVLLSPACSSANQFRSKQDRAEWLCRLEKSIGRGVAAGYPNINDINNDVLMREADRQRNNEFAPRFFEGKPRSKKSATQTSMKGREQRQANE